MGRAKLIQGDLPEDIVEDFSRRGELAVDCEMMGLNPVRDRLCVIQIRADQGSTVLVQVDESLPNTNLKQVFEDPNIVKIFHYARMDCVFLKARLGIEVKNIYCTKLASKLARTYTDKHGLKELVREIAGDNMDKSNQSSDWGRERLTDDQLYYAEMDVKYLFSLRNRLTEMLQRENRWHLAQSCFQFLPARIEMDLLGYGDVLEH